MSLDKVNSKDNTKKDIDWTDLITHSEEEIKAYQVKIKSVRKSLNFFKKQADTGVPFPAEKIARHQDLS
jgi:hypothetical protein